MRNSFRPVAIVLTLAPLLAACSFSHTSVSSGVKNSLHQNHLASGAPVTLGEMPPTSAWGCEILDKQNYKWTLMKLEGQAEIVGGFVVVEKHALAYANKNKLKTNYIYYNIPGTSSVGGVNIDFVLNKDRVPVIFYKCSKINP
jgi:hypothetical protein